ncbi:hypothetical protein [Vibrio sp. HN007]|uniref:hypothetical protein n=1 Tax=Vibrio iocasae TaxID=3098914 RepID=UPI0035D46D6B
MKKAHHFHPETYIYAGTSEVYKVAGYEEFILPQFATWSEVPEYDEGTEHCKYDLDKNCWIVEVKPIQVTAYHKQTREPKEFDDKSLVTDDYTIEKPETEWDEWITENWVTNENNKYIAEYNQIDDNRREAYSQMVSPLTEEAYIKRYIIATPEAIAEAEQLEQQALAAREKIQTENPWPEPLIN